MSNVIAKKWSWFLAIIIAFIIIFKLALPLAAKTFINHRLQADPDYTGHVDWVSISLIPTEISLQHLYIESHNKQQKPVLDIGSVHLLLSGASLLQGKLQMNVALVQPKLYFIVLKPDPKAKKPPTEIWQIARSQILPLQVDAITVEKGEIHYIDQTLDPAFDIEAHNIDAKLTDLQDQATAEQPWPAHLLADAITVGQGKLHVDLAFNPRANTPSFKLQMALKEVQLNQMNAFLKAYTELQATQGTFQVYVEASAAQGKINGYIKPFFENVKLTLPPESKANPFKRLYKNVVEWLTQVLKNNQTNKTATKIDISGAIDNPDASLWSTIANLLRNAFLEALLPRFD